MRKSKASFALIPRELLESPPLGHFTAFEFALAAGLLILAYQQLRSQRHDIAMKVGKKAQRARIAYGQSVDQQSKRAPPSRIDVRASRSALLRVAGLSADGKNLAALPGALGQLRKPPKIFSRATGPLLIDWKSTADNSAVGDLKLTINGAWLGPPSAKVPMPLPVRSRVGLALWLFLHGVITTPTRHRPIPFGALCKRLTIPAGRSSVRERAIWRALDVVNKHADRLKLPVIYKLSEEDDWVRFVATPANADPAPALPEQPQEQASLGPATFPRPDLERRLQLDAAMDNADTAEEWLEASQALSENED